MDRSRRRRAVAALGLAVASAATGVACDPEPPPSFVVTTTADGSDAAPGDGTCEVSEGTGDCSLRAAIEEGSASGRADLSVPPGTYLITGHLTVAGDLRVNHDALREVVVAPATPAPGFVGIDVEPGASLTLRGARVQGASIRIAGALGLDQSTVRSDTSALEVASGGTALVANTSLATTGTDAALVVGGAAQLLHVTATGAPVAVDARPGARVDVASSVLSGTCVGTPPVSQGYTFTDDDACSSGATGDQVLEDVRLDRAGGPDAAPPPKRLSPLRDAVPVGVNQCGTGNVRDLAGASRPAGGGCDVGAVEPPPPPSTIVVDGCVITGVSGPPDGTFSSASCPGADLRDADLSGIALWAPDFGGADLSGADLYGSALVLAGMEDADLRGANLQRAYVLGGGWVDVSLVDADLRSSSWVEVPGARVDLTGADLTGAELVALWWDDSVFTGTALVPSDLEVVAEGPAGAVVTWPTPPPMGDVSAGPCDHPPGSLFPVGVTVVRCDVLMDAVVPSHGTFTVTVLPPTAEVAQNWK